MISYKENFWLFIISTTAVLLFFSNIDFTTTLALFISILLIFLLNITMGKTLENIYNINNL